MVRYITLLLFIGLAFTQDITIAVLDFETEGLEGISSNALSAIVRREVRNNKNYRLIDRSMMASVLQEQGFQQSGVCGNECAVDVGQLLGVQKMVTGNVNALGSLYLVEIFILDVGSGEIEKSEMFQHVGKIDELVAPLMSATKKMFSGDDGSISQIKPFIYVESVPSGAMAVIYLLNGERIDGDIVEIVAADKYIVVRTESLERRRISYAYIDYILHNNNGLTDYLQAAGKEPEPKPEPVIWSNSPDEILSAGLTFLQNNNLIDAEKYFYQALKIDSTFIPAIIGLAKVMIQYWPAPQKLYQVLS